MATWGYARVSSTEQNLDRQIHSLKAVGIDDAHLLTDKASGKDFNRPTWNLLVGNPFNGQLGLMRENDVLVCSSLDRLGRSYEDIRVMWKYITQDLKCHIKVLDMPLLDTTQSSGSLDGKFIADLVLQILSYNSERERLNIKTRQRQGIDIALAKGVHFGRHKIEKPANWDDVFAQWKEKKITARQAMKLLELKPNTFYRIVKNCA